MTAIWVTAMAVVQVGVARVARHRAQSAADLGALGAARVALAAPDEACDRAKAITAANGASLRSCSLSGGVAEVVVAVRFAVPLLGPTAGRAAAPARPGPPPPRGSPPHPPRRGAGAAARPGPVGALA
ncbi:MAG: hypothetical protein IRZ07_10385 [Microbispora sp.]|nr:hypothetical protein [Microbispora sp.]